jgi:GNAT superfamily N-acetyltransferase
LDQQQVRSLETALDQRLARRLERAESLAGAAWVQTRARVEPEVGATWTEVAGAYALFDGIDSPLTQTFGLGLFEPVGAAELEQLEAFYQQRGAAIAHNVSPLAATDLLGQLHGRGYRPVEFDNVLVRPLVGLTDSQSTAIQVHRIGEDEVELWAQIASDGWCSDAPEYQDFIKPFARLSAQTANVHCFLASCEGQPVATGSLHLHSDVALLAGASTIPSARGQGAQLALMQARLRYAAEYGAELAMLVAHPGSGSQRNAQRHGFQVAYSRLKWQLG